MAPDFLGLFHLCAEDSVDNANPLCTRITKTQRKTLSRRRFILNVVLYVRCADISTIISGNVCPLAWTIFEHMAKSLAAMTLNGRRRRRAP
jgi:hypothetical protein